MHQEDVLVFPNINNREIFHCLFIGTHVTGQLFPLDGTRGICTATDGTGCPLKVGTMCGPAAPEAVSFHNPLETAPLGSSGNIHPITGLHHFSQGDFLTDLVALRFRDPEFPDMIISGSA